MRLVSVKTRATLLVAVALATTSLVAPARAAAPAGDEARTSITLVTHDSFAVSKRVLRSFTRATGIEVEILRAGDAGAALNQAILTKDEPLGDVLFGVDTTFLGRALDADIFERYRPAALAQVPDAYRLDAGGRVTPVDRGDVCINYDKAYFADRELAVPQTLRDLVKPEYEGLLVVENPATSSPGLAFLLATVAEFGDGGWRAYWESLRENDVEVVAGWEEAFNGSFSAGEGAGDRPLVVSYASSPPVAVLFSENGGADPPPSESPIGTLTKSCFRQIEGAGILRGTEHRRAARRFVDFLLSERFQADLPLQMFVFPVREGTPLPKVFTDFAELPADPLALPADEIDAGRERWIDEWTDVVLR